MVLSEFFIANVRMNVNRDVIYSNPDEPFRVGKATWHRTQEWMRKPVCSECECGWAEPVPPYRISLPARIYDFIWIDFWNNVFITENTRRIFEEAGLTGFSPQAVEVVKVRSKHPPEIMPKIWELGVYGKGGVPDPSCGRKLHEQCPKCGSKFYTSFNKGIKIDPKQWDGSDFFWPRNRHAIVYH